MAACALFLIWLLTGHYHPDARLDFGNTNTLAVEMQEEGNSRVYSAVLPSAFADSQSLLFKSNHTTVEISVDGTTVYTYGLGKRIAGKSPGTYWHVASIPTESQGRELIAQNEEDFAFPFSVALGYAVFDAAKDRSFQETIKRSDAMMYLDKKKKKTAYRAAKALQSED